MPAYSNAPQHIPELFKEIMRNDLKLAAAFVGQIIPFETWRLIQRKRDLIRGAEEMLHWNKDKGNTA